MAYGRGSYGGNRSGGGGSYGRSGGGRSGGGQSRGRGQGKEYDNRNTVTLWKKDDRDIASDKHPDLNGKYVDGDGREFWASGWTQHGVRSGDKEVAFRIKIGDPCDDDGGSRRQGRRDDYDRDRPRGDDRDDRRDDRRGGGRDDRDDRRDDRPRDERYDQRREREEDDRRDRDGRDGGGSHERPFDEGRDGDRGGRRESSSRSHDDRDDDGHRDRPGPNDNDGGPAPEGRGAFDKDLDDDLPF